MLHNFELTDAISRLPEIQYEGRVFRVTGQSVDPLAPSGSGGRWAFPLASDGGCSVLYTSLSWDGAIAEVASYLALSNPMPSRPLHLHRLDVTAQKALRLTMAELEKLGISRTDYQERNYVRSREIGAALNFLGFDGLLVPSARWDCENLIIFTENHGLSQKLDKVDFEEIDWQKWASINGLL